MPEVFCDAGAQVGLWLDAMSHVPHRNLLGHQRATLGTWCMYGIINVQNKNECNLVKERKTIVNFEMLFSHHPMTWTPRIEYQYTVGIVDQPDTW